MHIPRSFFATFYIFVISSQILPSATFNIGWFEALKPNTADSVFKIVEFYKKFNINARLVLYELNQDQWCNYRCNGVKTFDPI